MAAKLFGLEGSTVRRIAKLFALDGSTPRRAKKLFSLDGSTVRLIFEDFSTFTVSGTSNAIVSPVNEIVDFGVRSDFNAGGSDVSVNASASGDTSNVGVSGITVDVDSSHTYSTTTNGALSSGSGASLGVVLSTFSGFPSSGAGFRGYINAPGYLTAPSGNGSNYTTSLKGWNGGNSSASAGLISTYATSVFASTTIFRGNGVEVAGNAYTVDSTYTVNGGGFNVSWGATGIKMETRGNNNQALFTHAGSSPRVKMAGATTTTTSTGRRARVQNGTNRTFTINGGGLTAGGNFATGALSAGASTGFITANSTSEAWTLVGVAQKNPATFSISNADNSIQVSGTFGDGENATQARDRIQSVLNGNSTFQGKFNTGVDADKTISGVAHKVVTFTSDSAENTSDFSITVTGNDGSNTTPYEATTTQGATQSLQTTVQVTRAVEGSSVSSTKAISSQANTDTAGAEVATLGGDISYDSGTNKLKVQDMDATINVSNAGSLAFSKD